MQEQVLHRIEELIEQGRMIANSYGKNDYWADNITQAQAWMTSAANAVIQIAPPGSFFQAEIDRLTTHDELKSGISIIILQKVHGVLQSILVEANNGLLAKLEHQVFATAFDDFLDHAEEFHRSGKLKESAVLVSAVLEDTLKRIAIKNNVTVTGLSLDPLIDELAKLGVFNLVKAKRMKSCAGIRNAALHAEWEKLDLKDVGMAINLVRELLDGYL